MTGMKCMAVMTRMAGLAGVKCMAGVLGMTGLAVGADPTLLCDNILL